MTKATALRAGLAREVVRLSIAALPLVVFASLPAQG